MTLPSANVTAVGRTVIVKGQVTAAEHIIIEGQLDGTIVLPDHGVAISGSAHVRGEVCANTITVLDRVNGDLTATALIELRPSAVVVGRLAAGGASSSRRCTRGLLRSGALGRSTAHSLEKTGLVAV